MLLRADSARLPMIEILYPIRRHLKSYRSKVSREKRYHVSLFPVAYGRDCAGGRSARGGAIGGINLIST